MKDFRTLNVWQKSHKLVITVYQLTRNFPKEELYGVYVDCIDEQASGTVNLHCVYHYNKDGNITMQHAQIQGGVVIGQNTGNIYHIVGVTLINEKPYLVDGSWTFTFISKCWAIDHGKGGVKWGVRNMWHVTITKDDEVIVNKGKGEVICE